MVLITIFTVLITVICNYIVELVHLAQFLWSHQFNSWLRLYICRPSLSWALLWGYSWGRSIKTPLFILVNSIWIKIWSVKVSPDAHLSKNYICVQNTRLSQKHNQSIIYLSLQQFLLLLSRVCFLSFFSFNFSLRSILRFIFWYSSSDPLFMFSSLLLLL